MYSLKNKILSCATMGTASSAAETSDSSDSSPDLDFPLLPEDIWIEILSHVPSSDLLKNCILVCHQWKELIQEHAIWKRKCLRTGRVIPALDTKKKIPHNFYRLIYIHNPFGRNLLKNPCGEAEGMDPWVLHKNEGDGWIVEHPPSGSDEIPAEVGSTACFTTSFSDCVKYQLIDLRKEGLTEEILDGFKLPIYVGEWHASRFDCGSKYKLVVALLDKDREELDTFEFGPCVEQQWTGRAWSKVSHVFVDYPTGVRYVGFEHSGCDTQFWAGHYGSKMTGGYVRFNPP